MFVTVRSPGLLLFCYRIGSEISQHITTEIETELLTDSDKKRHLNKHIEIAHLVTCKKCSMKCNMQIHSCRMKIKSFKCTICQEKFSEEIAMTNHIQSHVKLTNLYAVSWNTLYYYTDVKSTAWTEEVMLWSIPLSFFNLCMYVSLINV